MDVLRAEQPRALSRRRVFLAHIVKGGHELQVHALEDWMEKGYQAFAVMEKHLAANDFFAAGHYTIADIALDGYTHLAHECDFALDEFPCDPRLAQPRRRSARPRADGLAPDGQDRRGGRMSLSGVPPERSQLSSHRLRCSHDQRRALRRRSCGSHCGMSSGPRSTGPPTHPQRRRGLALVLPARDGRCGARRHHPRSARRRVRSDGGSRGSRTARTRLSYSKRMRDQLLRRDGEIHRQRRGTLADERGARARMVAPRAEGLNSYLHVGSSGRARVLPATGFRPFTRQIEIVDDPRLTGILPRTAAPQVPIIEVQGLRFTPLP